MKNISGNANNWNLDGKKETKKETKTIEPKKEIVLDLSKEVKEAQNLLQALQKKYENSPKKKLGDAIISLTQSINSLN